jgi:hypothetical protein
MYRRIIYKGRTRMSLGISGGAVRDSVSMAAPKDRDYVRRCHIKTKA